MGVAHHAAYAPWLEIARTELLRDAGASYAALEAAGVFLVIVRLEVRYRRPILYDDMIEVSTRVTSRGRVKIDHEYELCLVERTASLRGSTEPGSAPGDVLAAARTTLACVDRAGRPGPLPDWLSGAGAGAGA